MTLSPILTVVFILYRWGAFSVHRVGFLSVSVLVILPFSPAGISSPLVVVEATILPSSRISSVTVGMTALSVVFFTVVSTSTLAADLVISGVLTKTPQCSMCTGLDSVSHTWR